MQPVTKNNKFFYIFFTLFVERINKKLIFVIQTKGNTMIRFNKNKVRFSVSNLMSFKTWAAAKKFANKVNIDIIVVRYENVEIAYKTDTWKTSEQILFDVECELYLK